MSLTDFVRGADEIEGLGEDAILVKYRGIWYFVDLETKKVSKLTSDEDLRLLVGGGRDEIRNSI
jgi:hypothetical protein